MWREEEEEEIPFTARLQQVLPNLAVNVVRFVSPRKVLELSITNR